MGLERAAAVLQGKANVYETDLFRPIIDAVCNLTGREYGSDQDTDYGIRVVAEHARAASFLISDGVVPSNSDRGYVLRRIIRRAIRYGRQLGLDRPFMTEVTDAVIARFADAYPALAENDGFIRRVVGLEETQFLENIRQGMPLLEDVLASSIPPREIGRRGSPAQSCSSFTTPTASARVGRRNRSPRVWLGRRHGRVQRRNGRPSATATARGARSRAAWKSLRPTRTWAPVTVPPSTVINARR